MISIFETDSYRGYLPQRAHAVHGVGRGLYSEISRAIGCQPSYLTQILKGKSNLSLEQAERLNGFLAHDSMESNYFLLMVEHERAGTPGLRTHFERQLHGIKKKHGQLARKVKPSSLHSPDFNEEYFKNWVHQAVHVLLSVPGLDSPQALAHRLRISQSEVTLALDSLVRLGVVSRLDGRYSIQKMAIHLPKSAKQIRAYHLNWRLKTLERLSSETSEQDLFYSSLVSVSAKDSEKFKEKMRGLILEFSKTVEYSTSEKVILFNLDYFEFKPSPS